MATEKKSSYFSIFPGLLFLFLSLLAAQTAWVEEGSSQSDLLERLDAYPEVIVLNGKIAVMDEKLTMAQAMAVRGRRVIALGTDEVIKKLAGPRTQIMDVKGRAVLPGLIDSHTHPHLWLMNYFGNDPGFRPDPQLQVTPVLGLDAVNVEKIAKPEILNKVQGV